MTLVSIFIDKILLPFGNDFTFAGCEWNPTLADQRGSARDAPPPRGGPNSFIFMQFSAKKLKNNSTFGSWRTPSGKSWIRHCFKQVWNCLAFSFNTFIQDQKQRLLLAARSKYKITIRLESNYIILQIFVILFCCLSFVYHCESFVLVYYILRVL